MSKTYVCAMCHEEFDAAWTDEEALAEMADDFPGFLREECVVVCDPCHREFKAEVQVNKPHAETLRLIAERLSG